MGEWNCATHLVLHLDYIVTQHVHICTYVLHWIDHGQNARVGGLPWPGAARQLLDGASEATGVVRACAFGGRRFAQFITLYFVECGLGFHVEMCLAEHMEPRTA